MRSTNALLSVFQWMHCKHDVLSVRSWEISLKFDLFDDSKANYCKVCRHCGRPCRNGQTETRFRLGGGLEWAQGIVLDEVQIPHVKGQLWGIGAPIVKYVDFLPWAVQKWLNRFAVWVANSIGPKDAQVKSYSPDDTLPWAVQKWLNWSICRLGCGLGWAQEAQT